MMTQGVPVVIGSPDDNVVGLRNQSSIATLASHGVLDMGQVAAAFRFRNAYEVTLDAKRESIGFNEWLSPGPVEASLEERRMVAATDLRRCRELVGAYAYSLLGKVCGEGHSINDLYQHRRDRDTHVDILKIHLSMLSRLWA